MRSRYERGCSLKAERLTENIRDIRDDLHAWYFTDDFGHEGYSSSRTVFKTYDDKTMELGRRGVAKEGDEHDAGFQIAGPQDLEVIVVLLDAAQDVVSASVQNGIEWQIERRVEGRDGVEDFDWDRTMQS